MVICTLQQLQEYNPVSLPNCVRAEELGEEMRSLQGPWGPKPPGWLGLGYKSQALCVRLRSAVYTPALPWDQALWKVLLYFSHTWQASYKVSSASFCT